jgi:hypothetical protein
LLCLLQGITTQTYALDFTTSPPSYKRTVHIDIIELMLHIPKEKKKEERRRRVYSPVQLSRWKREI